MLTFMLDNFMLHVYPVTPQSHLEKGKPIYGVSWYVSFLLEAMKDLPASATSSRCVILRSLRKVMAKAEFAKDEFVRKSGLYKIFTLLERLQVSELEAKMKPGKAGQLFCRFLLSVPRGG